MIIIKFSNRKPAMEDDSIGEESSSYLSGIINWQLATGMNTWNPPYDLLETQNEYFIRVEIAGMQEQDFDVSFQQPYVLIKGHRHDEMDFARIIRWKFHLVNSHSKLKFQVKSR